MVTSAVSSPGDLLQVLTEPMMGGRFWADFYRPVSGLLIAVDHALWGLDAFGYQLTTLLLFLASVVALFALVLRTVGSQAGIGAPLVAAGLFALFPTHVEVLPVPARRPEVLASLLSLLTLLALSRPRALESRKPLLAPGVLALLAIGAKETALLLPPLGLVCVFLYSPRASMAARARHALVASVPLWIALALATSLRLVALGSLGGHGDATTGLVHLPRALDMALALLHPQQAQLPHWAAGWLEVLTALALVTAAFLVLRGQDPEAPAHPDGPTRIRSGVLAASWLGSMLLLHAYTGKWNPWYLFFPTVGFVWLVGVTLDGLVAHTFPRAGSDALGRGVFAPGRGVFAAAAVLLAGLVAWQASYSPLVYTYSEWQAASRAHTAYLAHVGALIESAPDGSVVEPGSFPQRAESPPARPGRARVRGAAILYVHSVQSWAELSFPGRRLRVVLDRPPAGQLPPALADWVRRQGGPREPEADELVLVLPAAGRIVRAP